MSGECAVPTDQLELDRRHELAEFLRSRRARIAPEQAGLPRGTRRRTPGLRREEVALLAGVSPEWYTWLEQGRDITVSGQLLESLARVLRLDANEREHLFLLALRQPPPVETYTPPTVSLIIHQFIDQLGTTPACVLDIRSNILAQNVAHCVVFGDLEALSERDRNLIWRFFTSPMAQQINAEWEVLAQMYLAHFRAEYGRFINDPWWTNMIADLSQTSPYFQELWARHEVLNISEGRKTMHHSRGGELTFDFLWLRTVDADGLRLLIHTPHNIETVERIERLMAGGAAADDDERQAVHGNQPNGSA